VVDTTRCHRAAPPVPLPPDDGRSGHGVARCRQPKGSLLERQPTHAAGQKQSNSRVSFAVVSASSLVEAALGLEMLIASAAINFRPLAALATTWMRLLVMTRVASGLWI
jgi:hypothetical protein